MAFTSSRNVAGTELFVPPPLLQFLLELESTRTTDEVWDLFLSLSKTLGLDVVDYCFASDHQNWEQAQFIRTTFHSTWLERLKEYPHIRQTSNFRMHGCNFLTPVLLGPAYFDEMGDISADKRRHVLLSAEMGLEAGVGFSLRSSDHGQAGFIAWGGRFSRSAFDAIIAQHGWTLHAASMAGHLRYQELFRAEFFGRNELTPKQRELITLVGQGLMDKQIAHDLGISFSAVRQRLASVQQKTGARNRADLAALAMRMGLVADTLMRKHENDLTVFLSMGDGKQGREVRALSPQDAVADQSV